MKKTVTAGALAGLLLGILAGAWEVVHLALFVRGAGFLPSLFPYAFAIDGGFGAVAGALVGILISAARAAYATLCRVGSRDLPDGAVQRRLSASPIPSQAVATNEHHSNTRRDFLRQAAMSVTALGVLSVAGLKLTGLSLSPRRPAQNSVAEVPVLGSDNPPNVLLITIDTLRADQLGCYGHPFVQTPALDRFASQGAMFTQNQVQQPQTNPSHASIFTGMYPSSDGVRVHMVDHLPTNLDTLATVFTQAGYTTAGLYSWVSFDPQYSGFERGFQVYRDLTLGGPTMLSNPVVSQAAARYRVAEQYLYLPNMANKITGLNQSVETSAKGRGDVTTDAAIAQLSAFGSQPFFMWLHYFDPHYPYEPPSGFNSLYDANYTGTMNGGMPFVQAIENNTLHPNSADTLKLLSLYQGEITYLDTQLARLFAALDSMGLTSSTVVAITGDHGESFAEHKEFEEDGNFFHPHSLFSAEQRTPLLIRYPKRIAAGTTVSSVTQSIDLFPTLIEFSGMPVPAQTQGTSLKGLLDGTDDGSTRAAYSAMPDYVFTSIVTSQFKLIQNNASGQRIMYDVQNDPLEQHDLYSANPSVATDLTTSLNGWMKAVKISS